MKANYIITAVLVLAQVKTSIGKITSKQTNLNDPTWKFKLNESSSGYGGYAIHVQAFLEVDDKIESPLIEIDQPKIRHNPEKRKGKHIRPKLLVEEIIFPLRIHRHKKERHNNKIDNGTKASNRNLRKKVETKTARRKKNKNFGEGTGSITARNLNRAKKNNIKTIKIWKTWTRRYKNKKKAAKKSNLGKGTKKITARESDTVQKNNGVTKMVKKRKKKVLFQEKPVLKMRVAYNEK